MSARAQSEPDSAIAVERASKAAVAAMDLSRHTVRVLPLLVGSDELRVSLRGLAAWYERLCLDGEYATPAPAECVEALPQIVQLMKGAPPDEVVNAWWAVRVAEEVVSCRRLLWPQADTSGTSFEVALAQLEIAMHGWHEHLSQGTG